jgi:hypothetical protein
MPSCGLRSRLAAIPSSTARLRIRSTVALPTPRSSATSASVIPSSAFTWIWARCPLSFETRLHDARSSKPNRSSSVRLTMYRVAIPNMEHTQADMESENAIVSMETGH